MPKLKNVLKEMNAVGVNVVSKAKANLGKSNSSGALSESLTYEIDDRDQNNPVLSFYALDYGKFVDQGVQGNDPQAQPPGALARYNKAPGSPYQFGTGSGSGSLRGAIDKWVVQKGIPNVRDEKGRFIKRKSLVYLMTRSIWNTGIRPTYFFEKAQDAESRGVQRKFAKAYAKDIEDQIKEEQRKKRKRR
tara:strand:+ start:6642 stop:7211 length:570 start_codon:yes stop_codon:yes gene_type:complete